MDRKFPKGWYKPVPLDNVNCLIIVIILIPAKITTKNQSQVQILLNHNICDRELKFVMNTYCSALEYSRKNIFVYLSVIYFFAINGLKITKNKKFENSVFKSLYWKVIFFSNFLRLQLKLKLLVRRITIQNKIVYMLKIHISIEKIDLQFFCTWREFAMANLDIFQ